MFKNRITVSIVKAELVRRKRKKNDEDHGDLLSTLKIEMPMNMALGKELGPGVVALIKSKNDNEPKVLPFEKATLPDKPTDLRLSVFDSKGVKFEVDGCKVKKMHLSRVKGAPSKTSLGITLMVPPMQQAAMSHINNAVGTEIEIAIIQPQQELEI